MLAMLPLGQLACRIFRVPFYNNAYKRNAAHHLLGPLWGPQLKCYWPIRMREFTATKPSMFSSRIPTLDAQLVARKIFHSHKHLPYGISSVYRSSINEWRHKRKRMSLKDGKPRVSNVDMLS